MPSARLFSILSAMSALAGCTDDGSFGSDGATDDSAPPVDVPDDSGDSEEPDETAETGDWMLDEVTEPGTVRGTITFDLYTYDESGALIYVDWADYYGDQFPFGSVFVSGYTVDVDGTETWYASDVIADPSPTGDDYELEFGFDTDTEVYIYAALDYWGEGLIAPYEPSDVYPEMVLVSPDGETEDIDITLIVPYYDFSATGGYWDPDLWVLISGAATVTEQLGGACCMALVYDTTGYGPYGYASFTPTETAGGAEGTYAVYAPKGMGESQLLGACDANLNSLLEPSDWWGGYSTDGDEITNVTIGTEAMTDHEIQIPLGVETRPPITYSGNVLLDELTMAQVTDSNRLYITAQKYRPTGSFDPVGSGRTHDYDVYTGTEITEGNRYSLTLPSNVVAYLWACLDTDADGTVNEAGEPCGQPTLDGRLATGSVSTRAIDFWIHTLE